MASIAGATAFELSGGALCLDFANTARYHGEEREDLKTYGDLVAFGVQTGVLKAGEARRLKHEAARNPRSAEHALERARTLRAAVYHAFAAIAAGRRVLPEHLATINDAATETFGRFRLVPEKHGFAWALVGAAGAADLDLPRAAVARSAADLLTSDELAAVRECALDTCAWLFLDRSKNQKRRWCDMKVCGNRSKARRHYERSRATRKP